MHGSWILPVINQDLEVYLCWDSTVEEEEEDLAVTQFWKAVDDDRDVHEKIDKKKKRHRGKGRSKKHSKKKKNKKNKKHSSSSTSSESSSSSPSKSSSSSSDGSSEVQWNDWGSS